MLITLHSLAGTEIESGKEIAVIDHHDPTAVKEIETVVEDLLNDHPLEEIATGKTAFETLKFKLTEKCLLCSLLSILVLRAGEGNVEKYTHIK